MVVSPLACDEEYAPVFYLGKPGALTAIKMPDRDYTRTGVDHQVVHDLLDGFAVSRGLHYRRTWGLNYSWLYPDAGSVLMEYVTRQRGVGPFVFIDPHTRNQLTPNQASGTDALISTEGFTVFPSVPHVADTFTRTVAAGGWGSTTPSGHAYTVVGTAANYSVSGGNGLITPSATGSDRFATVVSDAGTDRIAFIDGEFVTLPASGTLEWGLTPRYVDASNHYVARLTITTAGVPTLSLYKRVAGVLTSLGSHSLATTYGNVAAATQWHVETEALGTTIRAKSWVGSIEPDWQIEVTDASITTGTRAGVYVRNDSAATTHTFRFDSFIVTAPDETIESTDAQFLQGERSLKWSLPAAVTAGLLQLDPSTGLHGWATPNAIDWAFSGSLRVGGTDTVVTITPNINWYTKDGVYTGTSGGTPIDVSGSWQSFCVVGEAPQDGFLLVALNVSTASVTGSADVYVDELQLEITLDNECHDWEYGQGQPLVSVRTDGETVPRIRRTNLNFVLTEVTP